MIQPFHLSFVVPDIEKAKEFYVDILDCKPGRDKGDWFDILFFGHQLTIHQERGSIVAKPIDHFGPILDKSEWGNILNRLTDAGVEFILKPTIKNRNDSTESGKYIVVDPAGNLLEFKYYNNRVLEFGG